MTINKSIDWNKFDFKEYKRLCRQYERAIKKGEIDFDAREELCDFLNKSKCRMPKPKYPYSIDDEKTHKYLDGIVYKIGDHLIYESVLNPKFKYGNK